ncbi:acyl-CoA dehydrogenase family protein [Flexivirga caeni]|uniref:acyl-CoA dehydrogenase family protein n=1 Tax=Flexivirga caeni TaxID=2294115 RepID=UPI001315369C|nr:acyl-CoA dehydrogenase family protein [Flexivirga caeni]
MKSGIDSNKIERMASSPLEPNSRKSMEDYMSGNQSSFDIGSAYLRNIESGKAADSYPGDSGPESIGVVTGLEGSDREQLEGLLAAARALRPKLRAEQAETEKRGTYSPEMHQAFLDAGFFRVLLPKMFGGLELGVEAFYKVITEVARGCTSSAWCLCFAAGRTLTLASYWPEKAQKEIFGEHGYLVSPLCSNPQPDVVITREERDGVRGLRISGTWKYCSGSPYSTHFMPNFTLPSDGDGEPDSYVAVLPRSSYTVLEDWGSIIGMRGSGSHGIHVEDAFVPEWHVVDTSWMASISGDTLGSRLHGNPVYGGPFIGFAEGESAAIVAGLGLAAVDEYERVISTSRAPWSDGDARRSEHPVWKEKFGTAMALVDSAVAMSARGGQLYEEFARRSVTGSEPFSAERALRLNNMYFMAENQVWEAVEMMLRSSGSRNSAQGSRLLRYFRDLLASRTVSDQFELFAVSAAEIHLGVSAESDL